MTKWSAYNNIEHLWSPQNKKLASVILPSVLDADENTLYQMTNLDPEVVTQKEAEVFDKAMELIKGKYWKGAEFMVKPCLDKETPYDDYNIIHKLIAFLGS